MYFRHAHAYADIPIGQEYEFIGRMSKGAIMPGSILRCKTTILAFFRVTERNLYPMQIIVIMKTV